MNLSPLSQRILTGAALIGTGIIIFFYAPPIVLSFTLLLLLILILIFEWPKLLRPTTRSFWLLPFFYLFIPIYLINLLNINPLYHFLVPYLFLIVSVHDTGSYIAGNLMGKNRILPSVSPQKTWEGFLGGYALTSLMLIVIFFIQKKPIPFISLLSWLAVLCIAATAGDFFESWLKRRAGIKDTSSLLPGHGGLLDRFDGILFAAVLFFIFHKQLSVLLL